MYVDTEDHTLLSTFVDSAALSLSFLPFYQVTCQPAVIWNVPQFYLCINSEHAMAHLELRKEFLQAHKLYFVEKLSLKD